MILCVNLNAAVDRTVVVDDFSVGAIHRPRQVLALAGGKGANAARVLHALGSEVLVTGWVGGHAGKFIEAGLRAEGIATALVHMRPESRTCYSVLDPARRTLTEVYETSSTVTRRDYTRFERLYRSLLPGCTLVLLSGSLPNGLPEDTCARLIRLARAAERPVFLDTSGAALRLGLEEGCPALAKPNLSELEALAGRPLTSEAEILETAAGVQRGCGTALVVSRGELGALAAAEGKSWKAVPPRLQAVSAVGSGDAMLAGMAHAFARGEPFDAGLRLGVAAGAANTLQIGAGRVDLADVVRLSKEVDVFQVD